MQWDNLYIRYNLAISNHYNNIIVYYNTCQDGMALLYGLEIIMGLETQVVVTNVGGNLHAYKCIITLVSEVVASPIIMIGYLSCVIF